eukprot:242533_1
MLMHCNGKKGLIFAILYVAMILFYVVQLYFLLVVLFIRLYVVFQSSVLRLSQISIRIYGTIYCLLPFILIISSLIHALYGGFLDLIGITVSFLLIIFLIVSMVVLFVSKLIKVYQNMDSSDEWIAMVTK